MASTNKLQRRTGGRGTVSNGHPLSQTLSSVFVIPTCADPKCDALVTTKVTILADGTKRPELVCDAHALPFRWGRHVWFERLKIPPLPSNLPVEVPEWQRKKGVELDERTGCFIRPGEARTGSYRRAHARANGGRVREGFQLDHRCCNKRCERATDDPETTHLDVVTPSENALRHQTRVLLGWIPMKRPDPATHCVHGHAFDEENTDWRPELRNGRRCLAACAESAALGGR